MLERSCFGFGVFVLFLFCLSLCVECSLFWFVYLVLCSCVVLLLFRCLVLFNFSCESLVGVELSCVQLSFVFSCSRLDAEFRAVSFILVWFS